MADHYKQLIADEKGNVVLNAPHEVQYWTDHLGVDETTLRAAIAVVGNKASEVRKYLADHKPDASDSVKTGGSPG